MTDYCQQCDGTGWAIATHVVPAGYRAGRLSPRPETWTDVRALPCDRCPRGLALAAAQAARRGKVAQRQARRAGKGRTA